MNLFSYKDEDLVKEQEIYEGKSSEYLDPNKAEALLQKAIRKAKDKKGSLGEVWEKLQLFFELIKAYFKGEYRNVSKGTILTILGAIIYFVSPIDMVPDFIVGLGILDDAAVIGFAIKKISVELEEFQRWKHEESPHS